MPDVDEEHDAASEGVALGEGQVEVPETGAGPFANERRAGRHRLAADETKRLGGTDTGPTPYDYLLAGLGACTTMTLRMYATRKKLPLDKVSARLSHQRAHAQGCADCVTGEGQIAEIQRVIQLKGELSAEDSEKFLEIANKCPVPRAPCTVRRTREHGIKVRGRLAED